MSTLFVLADGRIWGTSNGAYDYLLELIAEVLSRDGRERDLAEWLLAQRCEVQGPGVGYVDLRELAPTARERITTSIPSAVATAREREPAPILMESLELMLRMVESFNRGEPPEKLTSPRWLPHPPRERQRGPGW
jgi:hypothetical protein